MPILGIFGALFGLIGNGVKGFFGVKQAQVETVQKSLDVLTAVNASDNAKSQAASQIIAGEAGSGYWLAACIRPLILLNILILVDLFIFGVVPPGLLQTMPPLLAHLMDLLEFGLGGYIGGRTLEKIVSSVNVAGIIKELIKGK